MPDLSQYTSHYIAYMEQWLEDDIWQNLKSGSESLFIDIDQRRGKDGLIAKIRRGHEQGHLVYIDFNGMTTGREFFERFLTAYMQSPDTGIDIVTKVLVQAFSIFNPSIGLNPFTEKAAIFFPQQETDINKLEDSFLAALPMINKQWSHSLTYVFDSAIQFTEFSDKFSQNFIIKLIQYLEKNHRVVYLFEEKDEFLILKKISGVRKANQISSPAVEKDSLLKYFARFWDVKENSMAYKNLRGILDLISNDPALAWYLSNQIYIQKPQEEITFSELKDQLEALLSLNKGLYRNIYNALTNYQKRVLKALAITEGVKITSKSIRHKFELNTSPYVVQGLEFLRKKKLIRKYGNEHQFTDPLFRIWILKYF